MEGNIGKRKQKVALSVILVDFGSLMGPSPNFVLSILLITRATTKEGCEFMLVTADCL